MIRREIEEGFFLGDWDGVKEGLQGCFAEAVSALVGTDFVVFDHPGAEVGLQVVNGLIDLLAEGDAIELVEHCLVESLDDAVGLRALCLGPGVIDVLDGQVEFILVTIVSAAVLGATVGQDALQGYALVLVEENDPVV